jgi:hypothetical protein
MSDMSQVGIKYPFSMFKGEPGLRKSTEALSYPKPQYWISTDQKMEALQLPMNRWGIKQKDIQFDDYNDWDSIRAKLEKLQVNCPFACVIADSVTSLGDNINRQTMKAKNAEGGGKKVGGISVNSVEDYNAEASAFRDCIAMLKDINKHHKIPVILIAHVVGQRKNDDGNKLTHHSRVIVTGGDKISAKIAAYCTEVYHFNIKANFEADKEGEYGLFTVHTGNDFARTSLPLPREIMFNSDPLYEKWIEPAIRKLTSETPIERIQTPTTQPTQPTTLNNSFTIKT